MSLLMEKAGSEYVPHVEEDGKSTQPFDTHRNTESQRNTQPQNRVANTVRRGSGQIET
jgi:hypothetical protein